MVRLQDFAGLAKVFAILGRTRRGTQVVTPQIAEEMQRAIRAHIRDRVSPMQAQLQYLVKLEEATQDDEITAAVHEAGKHILIQLGGGLINSTKILPKERHDFIRIGRQRLQEARDQNKPLPSKFRGVLKSPRLLDIILNNKVHRSFSTSSLHPFYLLTGS